MEIRNMVEPGNSDPADSEALGLYAILRKVQEPLLESIFWLALGYALRGHDKEYVRRSNASEDQGHNTAVYRTNPLHSP
jgi:hypothetical protein